MAVRRLAQTQPETFEFTPENQAWAEAKIRDYPEGRQASAVIPILWKAQEQHAGWLPEPAIRLVADMLAMPYIRVLEVATFYTMFQLQPVGKVAHVNVCGTTPCMLRGSENIIKICKSRIAAQPFALSGDGNFSWEEVECAGACVNAPMVQIGGDTYEDLTEDSFNALLDKLERGEPVTPGPQSKRKASEPISGATSLTGPIGSHPQGAEVETGDGTPNGGLSPTAEVTAEENAGKPDGTARPEVETLRQVSGDNDDEPPLGTGHDASATQDVSQETEAAETAPADTTDAAPADEQADAAPADEQADAAPADEPAEPVPAEEPAAAAAPAHEPEEPAPIEEPEEPAPAEEPAEPAPIEAPAEPEGADEPAAPASDATAEGDTTPQIVEPAERPDDETKPELFTRETAPRIDNLQEISGIGPKIEATLNTLGVFTFDQIADWTEENAMWVGSSLAFRGRVQRERWVEQAIDLVAKRESGEA